MNALLGILVTVFLFLVYGIIAYGHEGDVGCVDCPEEARAECDGTACPILEEALADAGDRAGGRRPPTEEVIR